MKARSADVQGYVDRGGIKIGYEVYGSGPATVLLAPTWPIVDSGMWKGQVPYLARRFRVITVDPRGNGRSDRPTRVEDHADVECADDLVAVLDAVGQERAVVAGLCSGAWWATLAVSRHPDRFAGLVAISPWAPYLTALPPRPEPGGVDKDTPEYMRSDFPDYLDFYLRTLLFTEPFSSKQIEDGMTWGLQTTAESLIASDDAPCCVSDRDSCEALLRTVSCPTLVIYGTRDECQPPARMRRYAEILGAECLSIEGGGHMPPGREPVLVNHAMSDFVSRVLPDPAAGRQQRRWTRARNRRPRALYLSSPIGLGHARRDIAIADELRRLRPGLQIDWLTQHPVSALLQVRGERVHPASGMLASESAHIESECGEHDLHAFQAVRRMDEILVANFMVFDDLLSDEPYDVVIGDEAWDVDYFLHENPELKRSPFVWLTDFVGWLPMPSGGPAEAALTAEYNAEMIEQVERYPRLRDRSLFVGSPEDIVPEEFGPGLPRIREWTERHYDFTGYVTTGVQFESDRDKLRASVGYRPDEVVCVVSVGGSGVGGHLLRKVAAAHDEIRARLPGLRLVIVTGPRIDPGSVPAPAGVEVRGFVPDLDRHLAACDIAIVQGGLTSTMELVAAGRPFVYVPLRNHFEQNLHVRHRLNRYRAGKCLPYDELSPESLADAVTGELTRAGRYLPVETTGAATAASLIAEVF
jgi:pimeloyl-ACP methyl ester carboxylesterase/predicted glycosyltransferase